MPEIELSQAAKREQAALIATTERMHANRLQLEAENIALQNLIDRELRLTEQLREFLAFSRVERLAIDAEKSRLLRAA